MDSYIGDDLYNIFENNVKIKFLCDIKKTLLDYLINYINDNNYTKKYKNFDIEQYYMNTTITYDIAYIYDYHNDNIDTTGNLQHAILSVYGFNYVSCHIKDPLFTKLNNVLNGNNVINIKALNMMSIIDETILVIKKLNTSYVINSYILSQDNTELVDNECKIIKNRRNTL